MKFYVCKHCGNVIAYVEDSGVPVMCCGEKMTEIVPNTVDASTEKHVPVIKRDGNHVVVTVGAV
ncbi:MAG: desulfoferrodoxin, partial [Clostridia bacterium]